MAAFDEGMIHSFEVNEQKCFFVNSICSFKDHIASIHSYEMYGWVKETFGDAVEFLDYRFNDHDWAEFPRLAKLTKPVVVDRLEVRWMGARNKHESLRYRITIRFVPVKKAPKPMLESAT